MLVARIIGIHNWFNQYVFRHTETHRYTESKIDRQKEVCSGEEKVDGTDTRTHRESSVLQRKRNKEERRDLTVEAEEEETGRQKPRTNRSSWWFGSQVVTTHCRPSLTCVPYLFI
jgi:hypothetical protein